MFLTSDVIQTVYSSETFKDRARAILLRCAGKILKSKGTDATHNLRCAYAQKVLQNIDVETRRVVLIGLSVADLPDAVATAVTKTAKRAPEALASAFAPEDLDTLFVSLIEANWDTFAGVVKNPFVPA